MHPHTFKSTLFSHEKRDEVFVVMSFAPEFDSRWIHVIEPMICEDLQLTPNRVDYRISGESIIHDILDGISHSRLVLADITSTWMNDGSGRAWPQRNGNVMWEVGIAHTLRLPDEVVLVRSDNDDSIFDLTQFRAFQYDPANVPVARQHLEHLCKDRLRALDQSKSAHVRQCVDALDPPAASYLMSHVPLDGRAFTVEISLANTVRVPRLFELGILKAASYSALRRESKDGVGLSIAYECVITDFGRDVANVIAGRTTLKSD